MGMAFIIAIIVYVGPRTETAITAEVLSIGACGGAEGFFSPPYRCAVKVQIQNGPVEFWYVNQKVVVEQPVYKHCDGRGCDGTALVYRREGSNGS